MKTTYKDHTIYGVPIPLRYITPNMNFYPLVIPPNTTYINNNNNNSHINDAQLNIPPLSETYHEYFVYLLMESLGREFVIVGDFLIDMTRKDYLIAINWKDNEISIKNYTPLKSVKYFHEKSLHRFINLPPPLPTSFTTTTTINNNNIIDFLDEQCQRICRTTKLLETCKLFKIMNK